MATSTHEKAQGGNFVPLYTVVRGVYIRSANLLSLIYFSLTVGVMSVLCICTLCRPAIVSVETGSTVNTNMEDIEYTICFPSLHNKLQGQEQ